MADVLKVFDLPDGTHTAILNARGKIKITGEGAGETIHGALSARVKTVRETNPRLTDKEFGVLAGEIRDTTLNILKKGGEGVSDLSINIESIPDPVLLVNIIATHSPFPTAFKQELLSKSRVKDRAFMLLSELSRNEQLAEIKMEIRRKAKSRLDEQQRNMFLQNQFEALREELYGDDDDSRDLRERIAGIDFPKEVIKTIEKELDKLGRLNPQSPDYSVQYSYLDLLTSLPWNKLDPLTTDFASAEQILDSDHYGLEKVKERILEQLGRKYQRVSLGGLHDEAEIRGHRRTYIGAMPGRIIDAMKRAGSSNPVLLLDEIDKTGSDFKGDPSAALLEVLDPEQNCRFHDNYVDVDYDLSKVLFIATANTLSTLSQPLLDRMEIIDISGYLLEEKVEIARRHLIPRAAAENGFNNGEITFDKDAIVSLIENYTSESGVRQLEKKIAAVIRKIVLKKMRGKEFSTNVTAENLREYLGVQIYTKERYEASVMPGIATGLAWTAVGGEILFIESSVSRGKGEKLTLTGNLGDVMKESAMIAFQYVKAHAEQFGINPDTFETHSLHIHVPEGAIPKDGPSAGITMATSIVSALTGKPVRNRFAMTGEITLRGKVLPVGGIKEKILAAKRAGITDIILCADNRKDIEDIKESYLENLTFHYVKDINEVLKCALKD